MAFSLKDFNSSATNPLCRVPHTIMAGNIPGEWETLLHEL